MTLKTYFNSSIGKKQIVALTGVMLIGFLIGHLAGNLLIFLGPDVFNGYAKKLAGLRPGLLVIEFGLGLIFIIHIVTTFSLVTQNRIARGNDAYAVNSPKGKLSLVTRLMPITGSIIFAFVIFHLMDFTFSDHDGARGVLADGNNYGLYGVVVNSFNELWHALFYISAMFALGAHLAHGIESVLQTFGWHHPRYTPILIKFSHIFAFTLALGYSAIPAYIYIFQIGSLPR
jgi:succinate dehydrogenase / fumarate reductase, cytochrome b subunit